MKKKIVPLLTSLLVGVSALFPVPAFAAACSATTPTFFGLKSWYAYLDTETMTSGTRQTCEIKPDNFEGDKLITSVWKIVLTVLSDLFYLGGFLAVILIVVSGFNFVTSAGDAGKAAQAKKMLTGTIVGLVIVVLAQVIVNTILGMMTTGGGA